MRLVPVLAALVTLAVSAGAQSSTANRAFVRVTAKDSSGAPISAAEITVTRGLRDVVARGTTDDEGHGLFSVDVKDSTEFQVTMRKIGYRRGDRFFEVALKDTAQVNITVPRPQTNALAPVTVTAKRESRYNSYDLDADEIESSDLPLDNAWEVIKALRPVMLTSKGGCPTGIQEVWVNGKRIRLPLRPTGMAAARARVNVPIRARFSYVPVSVMSDIAPEHIQEIHYKDCFDHSMAVVGSNDAVFITLKPGIVYVQDVGSYVMDEPSVKNTASRP
jgi:hypothetical protein